MNKLITILPLLFILSNTFTPNSKIEASLMNQNFEEIRLLLENKGMSADFNEYHSGEVITYEGIELNLDKISNLGITFPSLEDRKSIKSADFNSVFSAIKENIISFNTAPKFLNTNLNLTNNINNEIDIINPVINYENDELTAQLETAPLNGTVEYTQGVLKYKPNLNYYGTDTFSYKMFDGEKASNVVSVSVNTDGNGIILANGVRTYFDGTTKKSCYEYLTFNQGKYAYQGVSIGSGVYKISHAGETVDVYCDMENDGGGWTLAVNLGNMPLNNTVIKTLSTAAVNTHYLKEVNPANFNNAYGKLSNAMINGIKHSTSNTSIPAYRWYFNDFTPRTIFLSGACFFQARTGAAIAASQDYCTRKAASWNETTYSSNPNISWCNQPNMPHVYFCTRNPESLQVVNNYESSINHNWAKNKVWIK